jgi:methyl-accepting chemotaxis protein
MPYINSLSWKIKLGVAIAIPIVMAIGVVSMAAVTIQQQNASSLAVIQHSTKQLNLVTDLREAILVFDRNLQSVIGADEQADIRRSAISVIKAASIMDEAMQRLSSAGETAETLELSAALKAIRPKQMEILKFGKRNEDAGANALLNEVRPEFDHVEELADAIKVHQYSRLTDSGKSNLAAGQKTIGWMIAALLIGSLLAIAVSVWLVRALLVALRSVRDAMKRFAAGDLNFEIAYKGTDELGATITALLEAVRAVAGIVSSISASTDVISRRSNEVARDAQTSAGTSEQITEDVDGISSRSHELNDLSNEVAQRANRTNEMAARSAAAASNASREISGIIKTFESLRIDIQEAVEKAQQLDESTVAIARITEDISSIADQTNLLALNAAIEAARAGEQGRGFAVVADEVRSLARRCGEAVSEISHLASSMGSSMDLSVQSLDKCQHRLNENIGQLNDSKQVVGLAEKEASGVADEMCEVLANIKQQKDRIQNIAEVTEDLTELMCIFQASVDARASLSQCLQEDAETMHVAIQYFRKAKK